MLHHWNIPDVISVDPGDEDLPLVVVDEQSSNHDGCLSVPTGHRETKSRLQRQREMRRGVARGKRRKENGGVREQRSESSEKWGSDQQYRETLVPHIRFPYLSLPPSHTHTLNCQLNTPCSCPKVVTHLIRECITSITSNNAQTGDINTPQTSLCSFLPQRTSTAD